MRTLLFLHTIGLLAGTVLGFIFPALASLWLILLCVPCIIVITELVGWWGFGNRWHDYRGAIYIVFPAMAGCALFGILLGSGKVGTLLAAIGMFISR